MGDRIKRTTLCYIENKGQWLMMLRDRKQGDANHGKWLGIGGKFEDDETPEECNAREVLEETGLVLRSAHFYGVIRFRADEYEDEDMYLFTSDDFVPADGSAALRYMQTGEYDPPDCEEGLLKWIDKAELTGLPMWEGDRAFISRILEGHQTISLTLRYAGEHCVVHDDNEDAERL